MLIEQRIQIQDNEAHFINSFAQFGFRSQSELISKALELLKREVEKRNALIMSANLYAEIYENDPELKEWTNAAIQDWQ